MTKEAKHLSDDEAEKLLNRLERMVLKPKMVFHKSWVVLMIKTLRQANTVKAELDALYALIEGLNQPDIPRGPCTSDAERVGGLFIRMGRKAVIKEIQTQAQTIKEKHNGTLDN